MHNPQDKAEKLYEKLTEMDAWDVFDEEPTCPDHDAPESYWVEYLEELEDIEVQLNVMQEASV